MEKITPHQFVCEGRTFIVDLVYSDADATFYVYEGESEVTKLKIDRLKFDRMHDVELYLPLSIVQEIFKSLEDIVRDSMKQ